MVYNYLLDLYKLVDTRRDEVEQNHNKDTTEQESPEFNQGRLDTLEEFRSFIHENFHNKLPRRMQ